MPRGDQCKWLRNQCIDELRLDGLSRLSTVHRQWWLSALIRARFRGAASSSSEAGFGLAESIRPGDCQVTFAALDIAQRNAALVALRTEPCHCYRDAQLGLIRIKSVTVSVPSLSVDFTTATLTSVSRKAWRWKLSLLSGPTIANLGPCSVY